MKKGIHDRVWQCLHTCLQVEELVCELNRLVSHEGATCCQVILELLAHIKLPPEQAEAYWHDIVAHRQVMSRAIGRSVTLQTAICDFCSSVHNDLKLPKVVELTAFEEMARQAHHDFLTGLNNRAALDCILEKELARARRYHRQLSLIFFDLDDFKSINDSFGHLAGDAILKEVGAIITREKRLEDAAGRYGGEEFIVILPDTSKVEALVFAERIRAKIENFEFAYGEQKNHTTISGGVASWPADASQKSSLVACADQALYKAKSAGKNLVALYGNEKRCYVRIAFTGHLDIKSILPKHKAIPFPVSKNISLGGVLFESARPLEVDTSLEVIAYLNDGSPLTLQGKVRRVRKVTKDKYEIGVSFAPGDVPTTLCFGRYITACLKRCDGPSCSATNHALQAAMASCSPASSVC